MKFKRYVAFCLGLAMSSGVAVAQTPRFNELVWADEFNGKGTLDATKWTYDLGSKNNGWGNQELQHYTNAPENVRQENGHLVIEALKKDGKWTSARVKTQGKYGFTYGRAEFRAKLPTGVGTWPALWLLGESITTKGWPACGEIDVMEHVGRQLGRVQSVLHTPASHGNTVNLDATMVPDATSAFHLYAMEWTEQDIKFYVDDKLFYTYAPAVQDASTWPFKDDFFLIINLAIGGNLGSEASLETDGKKNGVDPALTRARYEVDYVRVYQNFKELSLSGPSQLNPMSKKATFTASKVTDASYKWVLPAGATIVKGQGTPEIQVNWGKASGPVRVQMTLNGQTYQKTLHVKASKQAAGSSSVPKNVGSSTK
ncbi:family 16 glycosylhydrolase [Rufibacter ruber]|uniref:family 16 glycosylhydrolase n=1 Tax=Rufibacter ruber TaxID=1783499 RepID=UPI0008320146|nr:family 16 glycosylhydrolase [Rufibacter ruber]